MKKLMVFAFVIFSLSSCKNDEKAVDKNIITEDVITEKADSPKTETIKEQSVLELKTALTSKGYKTFDYVDEKTQDTILMQQYFIAFLKSGPIRNQNEEEASRLQKEHLAHLKKMYDLGYADISGPFGDDGEIRGITIYNVPTLKMADSLANADPMVKAGRLVIEIHPWWAGKGFPLR
ncbi:YciI family protein [Winogradskyella pulchriflava]|uniref:YciI family protein n=1 Tax=Winogradskyella pulchriflava TaxID=1110688 RepID=A0ABV6Q5L2_9FLAO